MATHDDGESSPLTAQHIQAARAASKDRGATLNLDNLHVTDIEPAQAAELASPPAHYSPVERLALRGNRLKSISVGFGSLTRLRYLNLRYNNFTAIPDILAELPSLDTLDLSHNRIKAFPDHPGHLADLRVLCLKQNKISRLPSYLSRFYHLEILQIGSNPVEWPPQSVLEGCGELGHSKRSNANAIRKLRLWLETNVPYANEHDDSGYGEHQGWENASPDESGAWDFETRTDPPADGGFFHSRSVSMDSVSSASSAGELLTPLKSPSDSEPHQSQHRVAGQLSSSANSALPSVRVEHLHSRTSSYAGNSTANVAVMGKKSLPDLRIMKDRRPFRGFEDRTIEQTSSQSLQKDSSLSQLTPPPHSPDDVQLSGSLPFVTIERNSYFRRSSAMLLNNSLPRSLQCLLGTGRSILFAVSQLYQTLEQYAHHGVDERLSTIFKKVLEPANVHMLHLIRMLDRFHDISQKSIPSPAVCRGLVECCRDTVTVFRKAINLLTLQFGLDSCDDARFVRWLILELYGITAEVAHAWRSLAPYLETLKPLLHANVNHSHHHSYLDFPPIPSPNANGSDPSLAPAVRLRAYDSSILMPGKVRLSRRHAGSFSSKDLEIGKGLPSNDSIPLRPGASSSSRSALRAPKRQVTVPVSTSSQYPSSLTGSQDSLHLRQGSHNSVLSSATPSPDFPSKTSVDKEIYQAVVKAISIAPTVWDQMEDALADILPSHPPIRKDIERARIITGQLLDAVQRPAESGQINNRILRENTHSFLKILVQLSNTLKEYNSSNRVSANLHSNMVKLTNCAQEFAILLHISSVPPTPVQSHSPSQLKSARSMNGFNVEDDILPSSLTRSRSAQPSFSSTSKLPFIPIPDSANGKSPAMRRMRSSRDTRLDTLEP